MVPRPGSWTDELQTPHLNTRKDVNALKKDNIVVLPVKSEESGAGSRLRNSLLNRALSAAD